MVYTTLNLMYFIEKQFELKYKECRIFAIKKRDYANVYYVDGMVHNWSDWIKLKANGPLLNVDNKFTDSIQQPSENSKTNTFWVRANLYSSAFKTSTSNRYSVINNPILSDQVLSESVSPSSFSGNVSRYYVGPLGYSRQGEFLYYSGYRDYTHTSSSYLSNYNYCYKTVLKEKLPNTIDDFRSLWAHVDPYTNPAIGIYELQTPYENDIYEEMPNYNPRNLICDDGFFNGVNPTTGKLWNLTTFDLGNKITAICSVLPFYITSINGNYNGIITPTNFPNDITINGRFGFYLNQSELNNIVSPNIGVIATPKIGTKIYMTGPGNVYGSLTQNIDCMLEIVPGVD